MVDARLLEADETRPEGRHEMGALDLARRLPSLLVAAKDVAATVMHGVHGRKRAGVGETFWQFRPFVMGESVSRIDWRRSARDERIYQAVQRRLHMEHSPVWTRIAMSMDYCPFEGESKQAYVDHRVACALIALTPMTRKEEA